MVALAPFAFAGSGCSNSGVIGDDCPTSEDCATAGSSGSSSTAGTSASPSSGSHSGGSNSTGGSSSSAGTGSGGASAGKTCGGILPAGCDKDSYCSFPPAAACGAGDQTGTCAPKPQACDLVYSPVCGCDGMTYGNACAAASEGISIANAGECGASATTCGGRAGSTCASDEYCLYTPAAICGRADATGTCTKVPKDAGCITVFDPVCGCDGQTYGNGCEAMVAGVSIDHDGACAATCGGITGGVPCPEDSFCNYPTTMACGNADGQGTCTLKPGGCTKELDPVCGCDGTSYSNPCMANAAGTSVASQGACK